MNSDQSPENSALPCDSASKAKAATFLCEYKDCLKAFKAKKSLIDHTRIHKGEKPYSCHFMPCSKAFTQYSSLQKHERIHKGEKPYNCETCGQAFTQVSNLKRHERSHRGERPYSCDVCSKGFTTSSNLKQHYQTHLQKDTRDKYECESCGKAYNYNSSLKKHLQEHGVDSTKKEPTFGSEYIDTREFMNSCDKYQIPLNNMNLMENPNKPLNNLYNFPLSNFPHSNIDFYPQFQPNLMFSDFFQTQFIRRPGNENINVKRSPDHDKPIIEKYETKPHSRLYKDNHCHTHTHSLICEHLMIIHQGHVDYLHDGKLHHVTSNGICEEHELELSEQNPVKCKSTDKFKIEAPYPSKKNFYSLLPSQTIPYNPDPSMMIKSASNHFPDQAQKDDFCVCALTQHVHNEGCEHPMIIHNGHVDYIVEGQLHHVHDGHCDIHGTVIVVDKFMELQRAQRANKMYGGGVDNGIPGY